MPSISNHDAAPEETKPTGEDSGAYSLSTNFRRDSFFRVCAYIFILGSIFSFLSVFMPFIYRELSTHLTTGILSFLFGYILLLLERKSGKGSVPEGDRLLFESRLLEKSEQVDQYRSLREVVGIAGFFKNIGLVGLPLATISITVLFCILAIFCYLINAFSTQIASKPQIIPDDFPKLILELSKLTLGAFIGSFVAKATDRTNRTKPNKELD